MVADSLTPVFYSWKNFHGANLREAAFPRTNHALSCPHHARKGVVHIMISRQSVRRCARALALIVVVAGFAGSWAFAQKVTATIVGTVTDPQGAAIPGVHVQAHNNDTGIAQTTVTNGQGEYRMEFVPVGHYTLTFTASGFKKYVQQNVVLTVEQVQTVNAALAVGATSETVTVTAAPPLVNTTNPEIGFTVQNQDLVSLPLVNRDPYQLLSLTPGVQHVNQTFSFGYPEVHAFINGGSDNGVGDVSYYLDGGINLNTLRNTGNQVPNPDAIQEFRVETNNYAAEYGRFGSGVINVITRSGTNSLHGSAFEFFRNDKLNATPWAANSKPPLHRNQFGATLGGPIIKNRTFFFGSYGGLRQTTSQFYNSAVVPTALERQGNFSKSAVIPIDPTTNQPFAYNGVQGWIPPNRLDPTALALLNPPSGLPGVPQANQPNGVYQYFVPNPFVTDEFLGKLNHQLTQKHQLMASYYITSGHEITQPAGNLPWSKETYQWRQHDANVSDTWAINDHMVNQLWLTYTRFFGGRIDNPRKSLADYGSAFRVQGVPALPNVSVSGAFTLGEAIQGPVAGMNFYAIRDVFNWTKGRNNISLGGELSLNKDITETFLNNYGTFSFTGAKTQIKNGTSAQKSKYKGNPTADFLLGLPNTMNQDTPDTALDNAWYTGLFVQDDFKIMPRLTLNFGLRYDLQTPPTDPQNREDTFVAGVQSKVVPAAPLGMLFPGDPGVGRGVIPARKDHFSPRVGFAWDPFGDGKTSVRAGAGIFYGSIAGNLWNAQSNFQPFAVREQFNNVKSLTDPYGSLPGGVSPFPYNYSASSPRFLKPAEIEGVDKNFTWPYTYQASMSIQRQVTNSLSVMAAYVGSWAHNLPFAYDLNYPLFNPNGITPTTSNVDARRPLDTGTLAQVFSIQSHQTSTYNALQVSAQKRMGQHFTFNGYYTFAKSLDSVTLDSTFVSVVTPQDYANLREERGRSDFDQRHMFVASGIWDLSYMSGGNRFVRAVANGWQISPIVTLHSGQPFNLTSGKDNNFDGNNTDRPNLVGGVNPSLDPHRSRQAVAAEWFNTAAFGPNGPGLGIGPGGADGDTPRNYLDQPGYHDVDMAVFRNFKYERYNLQARFESTNLFNMVNLNAPTSTLTSSLFGHINSASGTRELQLGLRLTF